LKFLKIFRREQDESLTEAEQILAYQQTGSLRVLGKLYQPYMEMVFSVCYKYLRNEDESKDAVMQIFEKLVDDLKNHEVANFKSWLHRVAVNHSLMQIRAKRVFVEVNGVLELDEFIDPGENEGMLKLEGNLSSLERCMETLNNEQRVSISLFFKEEKCYREISDETGFDFNKVKSYIQNGKRNLKICMDKNGTI
jgi:RNA polymerase sigma factor (sigma-70 family)